tara:strand:- start:802 stop:957 length:156 start_codon:yes stop_codon:yes gene_type:complete
MSKKLSNDSPYFDFIDTEILELYQDYPEHLSTMCMLVSLDVQLEKEGIELQ